MISIDNYNHIYKKDLFMLKELFIIVVLILIIMLILSKSINYEKYYTNSGVLISDKTLKVYVSNNDLETLTSNRIIKIKNKEFAYTIDSISNVFSGNSYYNEVIMNVDITEDLNIENNVLKFKILLSKKTILEYIFYKIGGFYGSN